MTLQDMIKQGGATLSVNLDVVSLKDGFMVSLKDGAVLDADDYSAIALAMVAAAARAKKITGGYVGLWVDSGKCYVDVSVCVMNILDALELGRLNKQLAIWDNMRQGAIAVKPYKQYEDLKKLSPELPGPSAQDIAYVNGALAFLDIDTDEKLARYAAVKGGY